MAKKKVFEDPLQGIDPVMKEAFSSSVTEEKEEKSGPTVANLAFPLLSETPTPGRKFEDDLFGRIPVSVSVELGRCQISLKDVFDFSEGSIVELDRLVGEPLDLVVNGQVIAQGEVVAVDNNYGLRITAIKATPKV